MYVIVFVLVKLLKLCSKHLLCLFFRFAKDPQTDTYERSVFSVLDFFGNIGGLNEVLEIIGKLIVAVFAGRLFIYSIVSNLYQVDTTPTGK